MPTTLNRTSFLAFFDARSAVYTVTSDFTPVSGYALDNLKTGRLDAHARSPVLTTSTLRFDLGSSVEFNAVMLTGSNCTASVLRRFSAGNDPDITTGVVESGAGLTAGIVSTLGQSRAVYVPPWGRTLIYLLRDSISRRYVQWEQSDPTNPLPYQEWAAARIGLGYQLAISDWTVGKRPRPSMTNDMRTHDIRFELLTRSEIYELQSIARTVKKRRMLFIPEADNPATWPNDAIWCTLEEVNEVRPRRGTSYTDKLFDCHALFVEAVR